MIDRRQHDEEREPEAEAPADQLLLDRQQRLIHSLRSSSRNSDWVDCDIMSSYSRTFFTVRFIGAVELSAGERRLDAGEEEPRNQQADPDHEAEQADDIDGGELAEPSRHSALKFDSTPIEKNVRMKKMTRKVLASPIAAGTFVAMSAGVPSAR